MSGYFQFLRNIYFFQELSDHDVRGLMKYCHEDSFSPGEIIFYEGDEADRFYIILQGEVEVWREYDTEYADMLAVHGVGHLFGEMALVDDMPRSATVVSRGNTRVLYINQDAFHSMVRENSSVAFSIIKSLSAMVRKSNDTFLEDLKERNKKLEEANRELQTAQKELLRAERLSALGKFSSMILHDIRNPISVVKGYTDMLCLDNKLAERTKEYVQKMRFELERLNGLAGQLLDYSRGEVRLDMCVVNVKDFLSRLQEYAERRFASKNINIVINSEYEGSALFDHERMFRVFGNLIENSRKAMGSKGVFSLSAKQESKDSLSFLVSDTGDGMDQHVVAHIFEPFYSSSDSGGTGLGMAIVKNIVEAHSGTIQIESTKGQGAAVTITLPL